MATKQVAAARLVLDYTVFPRHVVDAQNVRYIMEAMRAGASMPAVIVEEKTLRVVDGFHRVKAALRLDVQAVMSVDLRQYGSDEALMLEAARLNAAHGNRLNVWDQTLCVAKLEAAGIPRADVAQALGLTLARVEHLVTTRVAVHHLVPYALKRTTTHLAGRDLTDGERAYNEKAGGLPQSFYVRQVCLMLEAEAWDVSDARLMAGLKRLRALLETVPHALAEVDLAGRS